MPNYPSDAPATQASLNRRPNEWTRVEGYDLARALAIWGMVTVHFWIVMAFHETHPAWLHWCIEMLDGRAAAIFVILAGVGVSLRTASAQAKAASSSAERLDDQTTDPIAEVQRVLVYRGIFLLIAGFLNLIIWKGDILRVYGVSLCVAATLINASNRRLLTAAAVFGFAFIALMFLSDYDTEWDWDTFTYRHLWTVNGTIRNLFYNGFRSVFPWTGLLLFGVWLGRQRLGDQEVCRRVLIGSLGLAVFTEIVSALLVHSFREHPHGLDDKSVVALFGTVSMPPLPLFLVAAGSTSVAVIATSLFIAQRFSNFLPVRALIACGQMAFTWYVLHIVVGLGGIEALGLQDHQSLAVAAAAAAGFFVAISLISLVVRSRGHRGPLEWMMRKVAG